MFAGENSSNPPFSRWNPPVFSPGNSPCFAKNGSRAPWASLRGAVQSSPRARQPRLLPDPKIGWTKYGMLPGIKRMSRHLMTFGDVYCFSDPFFTSWCIHNLWL
jgi:hypothetical protein